ncbi:Hexokinase [Penicillium chermesinum]|uniref:Phosphotransferase n=1 Tax=Penicillium chermesinum TaxID=63820 RepID=A0A9W9PK31_9EURO|nr:Hexokinase [Penicillium chermesinum]KAJ5248867.1 Hexokinase [Penicillium chermesinum]
MSGFHYRPEVLEDMPEPLVKDLKKYDDMFTLDRERLRKITDHFVQELEKGLSKEGGSIPMDITWVMKYPSGHEKGRFLTVDMGGTNLRVCEVELSTGKRDFEQTQRKSKLPEAVKRGTAEQLWDFIAEKVESFLQEGHRNWEEGSYVFPPGLYVLVSRGATIYQERDSAALDQEFQSKLPVKVVALVNDTTGTLIASHYRDPQVKIGGIFSTGVNAAYMEDVRDVPKLRDSRLPEDATVVINTEYGAFDNERQVLPLTPLDHQLDQKSIRPGTQIYEKMISGLYIGEMLRLILVTLHEEGKLFRGLDITRLQEENALEASFLSAAELDFSEGLQDMRMEFEECLSLSPGVPRSENLRAARLYACGIAAICKKKSFNRCHVGVDGSVFNKYSAFKSRAAQALREIFDWPPGEVDLIVLNASEDGSGLGAALAAALVLEGEQEAKPV